MDKTFRIFVINPGSTSTKLALYENESCVLEENADIDPALIRQCKTVFDQYELRMNSILEFMRVNGIELDGIDCFAARGCGGGNQKAGAYLIDEAYMNLCRTNGIPHISNLSPILAHELAKRAGKPVLLPDDVVPRAGKQAFVYDAEGVNERDPLTLLSGLREVKMNSGSHVLNAKIVARKAAEKLGMDYGKATVVVCHMGGGVSSSCHKNGRLIDSTYDSYAPERAGGIPASAALNFVNLCFSGQYTAADIKKLLMGKGGLVSYLGVSDLREVERRIGSGDEEAKFYFDGMVLGLAKAGMNVDAIALTGGMANSKRLTAELSTRVGKIAKVFVFPGSYEMESLATGTLRVLRGEESYHLYGTDK